MFKALFGGKPESLPVEKMPQVNTIIDVFVGGRPARAVLVETVDGKGILTKECLGFVGESAVIVYAAAAGRFRAKTKITSVSAGGTQFEIPPKVASIVAGGQQKRSSVRMDTLVMGAWRMAPKGIGLGPFTRASIRDISLGGCSLICDRQLKFGAEVEVELPLRGADASPLALLGEVMRHEPIAKSGKHSHGLRFTGVQPEEDRAITEFINRKQTDLRNRGLG